MEPSWHDKYIIAAIDLGTAYSGLTISIYNDKTMTDDARHRTLSPVWKSGHGPQQGTVKTPTVVLLNPDGSFNSFGYDAENVYAELASNNEHADYYYFRHFKMKLYSDKSPITETRVLKDERNREYPALDVFSYAIRFMKETVIERISEKKLGCEDDVCYTLTCPAIWTEHSKQFMKQAAEKAGIEPNHFRISLEPECAAVYIYKEVIPQLSSRGTFHKEPGVPYVIVDMGGGTVDIAVHRMNNDLKVEEISCPDGGPFGGINVNYKFEQFLVAMSGAETFLEFKEKHMDDYLELTRTFETKKCNVKLDRSRVTLKFPSVFFKIHKRINNEKFSKSLEGSIHAKAVKHELDKVSFDNDIFVGFFKETLDKIIDKVKSVLSNLSGCTNKPTIVLVGGFADSAVVSTLMKQAFPDNNVFFPADSIEAVMKGAVLYARDESIIAKRVSKYTIGLDWNVDFDPKNHPIYKREHVEDGSVCKDVFRKIIAEGEMIMTGLPVHEVRSYVKTSKQTSMEFPFYRVKGNRVPEFIDDPDCFHVGSMTVSMRDTSGGMNRYVILKVYCDKILRAEAIDEKGKTHRVEFNMDETSV